MLIDWLHGDLHHWAIFCCLIASLGLIGAGFCSIGICFGKGALGFLNGSGRQPTVIVVNGSGQYVQQPQRRTWGLGRTYLLFAAIFSGGPMLTLLIMGANHAAWYVIDWLGRNWWVPVVVLVLALVVGAFAWLICRDARTVAQERARFAALTQKKSAPASPAQPLWEMPAIDGHWSNKG